ncbi:hypothetical protein A5893_00290 [Pedobacter psychrophilus]|uniref:Uncharacterized protein n=1 Tax=Pedobacter psychrophilus TaxID=1826909 RepID=A0A179DKP1_9SPHI|nr:hypothetical protein [Pedobacter psychrophilus]OAQ41591.1 hypothetical protein A5893_00290 [Pedobacter psychrophilus]
MKTNTHSSEKENAKGLNINKPAYAIMISFGVIYLIFKEWSMASVMISLALVFDPFDVSIKWTKRPLWQRAWLILHLLIGLSLLTYSIIAK